MNRIITTSIALVLIALSAVGAVAAQDPDASAEPTAGAAQTADPEVAREVLSPSGTMTFEEPRWKKITPSRGPAAREDHTWTVDGEGRYAYLFGGRDGGKDFGDLWRFDLETDTWKKLTPRGKSPAARFGHSAVWVDGFGVILFAGQRGADFFGDLWVYDPAENKWTELPARGGAPKARYGSCMVVGPDGRPWISHGFTFAGRFDDTRAYNLKTKRWACIAPDGRRPDERCLHDCFTSATGELVLYGGQDNANIALGDLWVTRPDRAWRKEPDPKPKARRLYAVTEAGDHAWVFGGADSDNNPLDDLWRVDRETLEFERVKVTGSSPSARYAGTLITDAKRGRLLLFAGQGKEAKADVWQLTGRSGPATDDAPSDDDVAESSADPASPTSPPATSEDA